jgi:Ca2+-binding EF-hand superfamily protein
VAAHTRDLTGSKHVMQVYDGLLLDGKLSEYEEAFKAFDTTGNGTIGMST